MEIYPFHLFLNAKIQHLAVPREGPVIINKWNFVVLAQQRILPPGLGGLVPTMSGANASPHQSLSNTHYFGRRISNRSALKILLGGSGTNLTHNLSVVQNEFLKSISRATRLVVAAAATITTKPRHGTGRHAEIPRGLLCFRNKFGDWECRPCLTALPRHHDVPS